MKSYYVYILANNGKMLYTGTTSNMEKRLYEHKHHLMNGYTRRYNINKLVYFEETNDVHAAIEREKQIKGWLRQKKIDLIESINHEWLDLAENLFG
jgi:putative endonuclease